MSNGVLKSLLLIALITATESCVQKDSVGKRTSLGRSINITSASLVNNQLIIKGSDLSRANKVQIKSSTTTYNFTIESTSTNQIVANASSAFNFTADTLLDLVVSSAQSAATFPITFTVANNSITAAMLTSMGATSGQMLKYNGTTWVPFSPTSSQTYIGTWDANDFPTFPTATAAGDYYIVNVASAPYNVGDWIIYNGTSFDHIVNTAGVTSVFGRNGVITAIEGDYILDKMGDVDLTTTPPIVGDVLTYNGTKWVPNPVAVGSSGTVTNVSGTAPISVTNGTTTPSITISQANGGTNGYLSSADWTTFNNKQPAITAGTTSQYYRGDKSWQTLDTSVVPESVNLYFTNARTLGVPLTGFSATAGTVVATDSLLQALGKLQGQINLKADSSTFVDWSASGVQTIDPSRLSLGGGNAGKAVITNAGGFVTASATTSTEVGYLTGATSNIQTQLNSKQDTLVTTSLLDIGSVTTNQQNALVLNPYAPVAGSTGEIRFKELSANGTNYTGFKSPDALVSNVIYTLPSTNGSSGQVLTNNGSGTLTWTSPSASSFPTGAAGGDLAGTYPNPSLSNANLNALKFYNTNGILVQTAPNTFTGRSIAGTTGRVTVTNGDGVSGNPTINVDTGLLPSPAAAGQVLKSTGVNTSSWTTLGSSDITTALGFVPVNKAGDSITSGTFDFSGASFLRAPVPVTLNDVANKQYVDSFGQWSINGAHVYRSSGNVGIGMASPTKMLEVSGDVQFNTLTVGKGGGGNAYNTALGYFALKTNTTGGGNTATGYNALFSNTSSSYSTAIGFEALKLSTGAQNTAVGAESLSSNTTGNNNTAIGMDALLENISGFSNTAIGMNSLKNNLGNSNIAIGYNAGSSITTGSGNVIIGSNDGLNIATANNHILISDGVGNERMKIDHQGRVGLGGVSFPQTGIHLVSNIPNTASQPLKNSILVESDGNNVGRYGALVFSPTEAPVFAGYRALGSKGAPAPVTSNTFLNQFSAFGYDGSQFAQGAVFAIMATEGWTSGARGSSIKFGTTTNGTSTPMDRMLIDHNGNVGIGTNTPGYTLHVNGTIAGNSGYINLSDKRLKKNIQQLPSALEKIMKIRGVFFDWNKEFNPDLKLGDRQELGVIAQEVEKVYPQAVSKDEKTSIKSVAYSMLIAPLIEAVKELYTHILGIKTQLTVQSRQIASKAEKSEVETLKDEVKTLKAYICSKDPKAPVCSAR